MYGKIMLRLCNHRCQSNILLIKHVVQGRPAWETDLELELKND